MLSDGVCSICSGIVVVVVKHTLLNVTLHAQLDFMLVESRICIGLLYLRDKREIILLCRLNN